MMPMITFLLNLNNGLLEKFHKKKEFSRFSHTVNKMYIIECVCDIRKPFTISCM